MNEVLEFIRRRFQKDCDWCTGNCYWFAVILHNRFPQLSIYLFPIENHFVVGNGNIFYDWNGIYESDEVPLLWEDIPEYDKLFYQHLIRDCVN